MTYEFEMPWPPSVNAWKTPYQNRMILTKKGREYRKAVFEECLKLDLHCELIDKPVRVHLTLNPPSLRRYDVDNFSKSLFDALTIAEFWQDDELVHSMTVVKGEKMKGGNVQVKVEVL